MTLKKIFYSSFLVSIFIIAYNNSALASSHIYANYVSANNIGAIQHSIVTNAFQTFDGSAVSTLKAKTKNKYTILPKEKENPLYLYGHMPMYGTPHLYGEFGDDGSVFTMTGRNGGDEYGRPALSNIWVNWKHFDEKAKFKDYDVLDSDYDIVMLGLTSSEEQTGSIISKWGLYGGYVGGIQENNALNISEKGGYIGLYSGYNINDFNLSLSANLGMLNNDAGTIYGTDEYSNTWAGAALNTTYNIYLDDTFSLQPGLYAAYTWIGSANYISSSEESIANKNFSIFEITPSIRAIKHVGNGWFGYIGVKYVLSYAHGGNVVVNGIEKENLESDNYSEYGIGIEKSIDRFYINININRHDGNRYGWNGGLNLKYIF